VTEQLTNDPIAELLLRENLMTPAQLKTAVEFQKSLGGDLRNIVVKLGYVKDSVLANMVAQEQHVGASTNEIDEAVIDFKALEQLPREMLEKHQVIPLRSEGTSLVLAMADPSDLRAIEEIQFLVNRMVEPAVATKAAIRKAINQLDDMIERYEEERAAEADAAEEGPAPVLPDSGAFPAVGAAPAGDELEALRALLIDKLLRAYILTQVEAGRLSLDDLLARAKQL